MSFRQLLAFAGVALALLVVPSAVADPPTLFNVPSSFTVFVDGAGPYSVSYTTPTADDPDLPGPVPVICDNPPGNFSYGATLVTCTATDPNDLSTTSASFTVTVVDVTPPTLAGVPSSQTVFGNGVTSVAFSFSPSATEPGGSVPVTCTTALSFSVPIGGAVSGSCSASDTQGNTATTAFTISAADVTPPVVTVPSPLPVNKDGVTFPTSVTYSGVSALDGSGPGVSLTPTCNPPSGANAFNLGSNTVSCTATDASGNIGSNSFTITVVDNTAPVVTVPANSSANVNNKTFPTAITYSGVSAVDGTGPVVSLTPSCNPASGAAAFNLGPNTVTCTATDQAGNIGTNSFVITVADTTPPAVSITGGPATLVNVRTASLSFTTSEGTTTCQLDGGAFGACSSPANYSGLADGSHTFTMKAVDAANNSASASRSWSVDGTPPVLSLPPTRYNEANGPQGAVASYSISASDSGGALLPSALSCDHSSGSLFPLGQTTVTCSVTDSAGNTATGTFLVIVQDTTPPAINAPNVSFTASSANGALKTDPEVVAYLAGVAASDVVSTPTLTNDMPNVLAIGATTVVFTAKDAAGNTASKSVIATVLAVGQKAPPPDFTPPGEVTGAVAKPGDRLVTLSWKLPLAKDLAAVRVTESIAGEPGAGREIYKGTGITVTAKDLANGTDYRFLIITQDKSGNRSKGVILLATPKAEALTSPKPAQRVTKPPLLRWAPFARAAYYNVQLWRGSVKMLSAWPTVTRYQLTAKWTYSGTTRKLAPGLYTWYVWPGIGPRADAKYGSLLGSRTFTFVQLKPKKKS